MSSKAGCGFRAAHALKIPATKASGGNFGKASGGVEEAKAARDSAPLMR
jgi:hypothetical protein